MQLLVLATFLVSTRKFVKSALDPLDLTFLES